jgi:lysozyme family protein
MIATPRFTACLPNTLIQECPLPNDWSNLQNFSNDAHDPGGATMCGITQAEYDTYRKSNGLPTRDVRQLTQDEGDDIYLNSYWLPYCPKLVPGMDMDFFDTSVNEGCTMAVRILQSSLNLAIDGDWGPQTDAAVTALASLSPQDCIVKIKAFTARREAVYRTFNGYQYFGEDWERRSAEIGAQSIAMVPVNAATS